MTYPGLARGSGVKSIGTNAYARCCVTHRFLHNDASAKRGSRPRIGSSERSSGQARHANLLAAAQGTPLRVTLFAPCHARSILTIKSSIEYYRTQARPLPARAMLLPLPGSRFSRQERSGLKRHQYPHHNEQVAKKKRFVV